MIEINDIYKLREKFFSLSSDEIFNLLACCYQLEIPKGLETLKNYTFLVNTSIILIKHEEILNELILSELWDFFCQFAKKTNKNLNDFDITCILPKEIANKEKDDDIIKNCIINFYNHIYINSLILNILNCNDFQYEYSRFMVSKLEYSHLDTDYKIMDKFNDIVKLTNINIKIDLKHSQFDIKFSNDYLYIHFALYKTINIPKNNDVEFTYKQNKLYETTFFITPDNKIFLVKDYKGKKNVYPISIKELFYYKNSLAKFNSKFDKLLDIIFEYSINNSTFFKDVINDSRISINNTDKYIYLLPTKYNDAFLYYNKSEMLKNNYKLSNSLSINYNKRNINLSYCILKTYPYIKDETSKNILLQQRNINLLDFCDTRYINDSDSYYNYINNTIKDIIQKFLKFILINRITQHSSNLNNKIDNNYTNIINEHNIYIIADYIDMTLFSKHSHTKYLKECKRYFKLNVNSMNEIRNKHDKVSDLITLDSYMHNSKMIVKIPKNSKFNDLRNMLPEEFEWIKTKKRLISEAIIQHHCVASYADKITKDQCAIYSYVDKDGSKNEDGIPRRYTIEFVKHKNKYYIKQTQGEYNKVNASYMYEYISQFL